MNKLARLPGFWGKSLLSTLFWDAQLQFRHGFYYAGVFVAIIWIALFRQIPRDSLTYLIPPFLFLNLIMTTFYFVAGLVLLEKGQAVLQGLVVTPLPPQTYMFAKVGSLGFLAVLECLVIILLTHGLQLEWLWLLLGLAFLAALYVLFGLAMVVYYESINQFLFPSGLLVTLFTLPLLGYFDIWDSLLFYLLPSQGPLLLLKASLYPLSGGQLLYAVGSSLLWLIMAFVLSQKAFQHFIQKLA